MTLTLGCPLAIKKLSGQAPPILSDFFTRALFLDSTWNLPEATLRVSM